MTIIRRFVANTTKISKILVDDDSEYLWIAYHRDSSGICHVKKVSAHDIDQVYFDIQISAQSIVDLAIGGSGTQKSLGVLYNDDSRVLTTYATEAPFNTELDFEKPFGIPNPIALTITDDNIFVLLPGTSSGERARVLIYDLFTEFDTVIDFDESGESVYDATDIVADSNNNVWVITHTTPTQLIRIWFASGGWRYTIHSMQ
jgi:hypothetical protein